MTHNETNQGQAPQFETQQEMGRNKTLFRDLNVGDTFDFIGPDRYNSFFNRCTKTSTRKYKWLNPARCEQSPDEYLETQVGSLNCSIFHVNEQA